MHRIDRMWEGAAHQYGHAYRKLSGYPDSTWDTGAKQMQRVRQLYDRQAVRLGVITPPAGMKHGQQGGQTTIQLTVVADRAHPSHNQRYHSYAGAGIIVAVGWLAVGHHHHPAQADRGITP